MNTLLGKMEGLLVSFKDDFIQEILDSPQYQNANSISNEIQDKYFVFLRELQSVRNHVNELSPVDETENSKQLKALTILNHIEKEILHTFGCCFPIN